VGDDSDHQLQTDLLAYMREHPASADTLDAIAEWWVMRRIVHVEVEAVARALARLTEAGLVEAVEFLGQRRFRLAAHRP
jgi:Fe2+ or Zn2+ uptake regulation protein